MPELSNCAAQYIRMSADKQDLSPSLQKEAIAAYAAAKGMGPALRTPTAAPDARPSSTTALPCTNGESPISCSMMTVEAPYWESWKNKTVPIQLVVPREPDPLRSPQRASGASIGDAR